jgi:PAS domain S-box-containing protein
VSAAGELPRGEQAADRAAASRREADELRAILDRAPLAVVSIDLAGNVVRWSAGAERMFGWKADEVLGRRNPLVPPDLEGEHRRLVEQTLAGRQVAGFETVRRRQDGSLLPVALYNAKVVHSGGGGVELTAFFADLTPRKHAEEALRQLARRLQAVREEEQARLAREIHDELGQALTGIALEVGWLRHRLERTRTARHTPGVSREELGAKLDELAAAVEGGLAAVKRLALELHPLVVDLGLGPAVQWQVETVCRRGGLEWELDLGELGAVPPTCATVVFRVLQEALTNVVRHAGARRVRVELHRRGHSLALAVEDDGRGFDPGQRGLGLGLVAMRERAQVCAGTVEVRTAPGAGCRVTLRTELCDAERGEPRGAPAEAV